MEGISLSVIKKQLSEALFWKDEINNYIRWYKGDMSHLYFTPAPLPSQYVKRNTVLQSAISTWTELHQKPKYLESLQLSPDVFSGKKILDVGAGPIPSGTCFENCRLYCLDPLMPIYRVLGFSYDQYSDIRFIDSSAEVIPIDNDFFDAIISVNAIDHVDDLERVATELQRVAKPDCQFVMHVHYHKATVYEPFEINDELFLQLFNWVRGLRVVNYSQESYSNLLDGNEKFVLWSNMHTV